MFKSKKLQKGKEFRFEEWELLLEVTPSASVQTGKAWLRPGELGSARRWPHSFTEGK